MNIRYCITVALLVALVTPNCLAQELGGSRLTVRGKVRSYAKTDRARVMFSIKGVGKTLRAAFSDAETKIDTITTRLQTIGIDQESLGTSFFQSGENFGNKAFLSSKQDYQAVMTASITTKQLSLLQEIVAILSESEIEAIKGISFELTDYEAFRETALSRALEKAKAKARLTCKQLELVVDSVLEVEEIPVSGSGTVWSSKYKPATPFNSTVFLSQEALAQTGANHSRMFSQEVAVDSEVRVVFAISGGSVREETLTTP